MLVVASALEPQMRQDARGGRDPGIGDDESAGAAMQRIKGVGFCFQFRGGRLHVSNLSDGG